MPSGGVTGPASEPSVPSGPSRLVGGPSGGGIHLALAAFPFLVLSAMVGGFGPRAPTGGALALHVHAGALGWITLTVLAFARTLFVPATVRVSPLERAVTWGAIGGVALFAAGAATGRPGVEATTGAAALLGLTMFMVWLAPAIRRGPWTNARLAMAGSLILLLIGSLAGALAATTAAAAGAAVGGPSLLAQRMAAAHPAALVVPFIVLGSTSIIEACTLGERPADASGMVQSGLVVLSGVALYAGSLAGSVTLLIAAVPLVFAGVVLFMVRLGSTLFAPGRGRDRTDASGRDVPWLGAATMFLAVDVGLFAHVILEVVRGRYASADLVPAWLVFTVDHVTFVLVATFVLLGWLASATPSGTARGSWADRPALAGMVAGIGGTAAGLAAGIQWLATAFASVLGAASLLAAGVALVRVAFPATGRPQLRAGR